MSSQKNESTSELGRATRKMINAPPGEETTNAAFWLNNTIAKREHAVTVSCDFDRARCDLVDSLQNQLQKQFSRLVRLINSSKPISFGSIAVWIQGVQQTQRVDGQSEIKFEVQFMSEEKAVTKVLGLQELALRLAGIEPFENHLCNSDQSDIRWNDQDWENYKPTCIEPRN